MFRSFNSVELFCILLMLALVMTAAYLVITAAIKYERTRYRTRLMEKSMFQTPYEESAYRAGYIFGSLFKKSHIIQQAESLGYVCKDEDAVKIIRSMRQSFNLVEGINAARIRNAVSQHFHRNPTGVYEDSDVEDFT